MNDTAALSLLVHLEAAWPSPRWTSVVQDQWKADLLTLDEGAAGTALVRLRREKPQRPSFAEFAAVAKSLVTRDGGDRHEPVCPTCDGTGWVSTNQHPEWCKDAMCMSHTAVAPCMCSAGDGPRNLTAL